jgi:hypothetical protein
MFSEHLIKWPFAVFPRDLQVECFPEFGHEDVDVFKVG